MFGGISICRRNADALCLDNTGSPIDDAVFLEFDQRTGIGTISGGGNKGQNRNNKGLGQLLLHISSQTDGGKKDGTEPVRNRSRNQNFDN